MQENIFYDSRKFMKKLLLLILFALFLIKPAFAVQENIFMGNKNAPVNLRVYYSMTCYPCAMFHKNVVLELEHSSYVGKGQLSIELRPYSMNKVSFAIEAMLACIQDKKDHKEALEDLLFSQKSWNKEDKNMLPLIEKIMLKYMTRQELDKCYKNKESAEKLFTKINNYKEKSIVDETPSIFINGQKITDGLTYNNIIRHINKELK